MTAYSAGEGKGSEFVVKLPLAEKGTAEMVPEPEKGDANGPRTAAGLPESEGATQASAKAPQSGGPKDADHPVPLTGPVLLVEDNADSREIVSAELQAGYRLGDDVLRHAMVRVKTQ